MSELAVIGNTAREIQLLALIVKAGKAAARRFLEFFTVNLPGNRFRSCHRPAAKMGSSFRMPSC
jgi:hypothetical protein